MRQRQTDVETMLDIYDSTDYNNYSEIDDPEDIQRVVRQITFIDPQQIMMSLEVNEEENG